MEINQIILHGGGGHAKVVMDCLRAQKKEVIAVVDQRYNGPIFKQDQYDPHFRPHASTLIAIGDNGLRKRIAATIVHEFTNAIHPSTLISESTSLGKGCMVLHGAIVQTDTRVGDHVILNTACQVDHDCAIGNFAHIAPGAVLCGGVSVGEGTLIGARAVVIPGKKIGAWVTVGAGSVIIDDIPDFAVVVGNPGRVVKFNTI